MHGHLKGRTAIVTGATGTIGAAAAWALSNAGATVVLAADDERAAETLAAEITSSGRHAVPVPTDLTSPASVRRLVEQTLGAFGSLDAAINNAVLDPATPLTELRAEDFDTEIYAGIRRVFLAMKYQIPALSPGTCIVNAVSADGAASSLGVIGLTRTAAHDYADRGIRINAVAAGPRPAEEIANAIVWLCTPAAAFLTGETLRLDRAPATTAPS